MKKSSQYGLSLLGVLALLVVIVAIFAGGWHVYKTNTDKKDTQATVARPTSTTQASLPLKIDRLKVPAGWKVDQEGLHPEASNIQLSDATSGCSAGAYYTVDTAESNSPTVDHYQQTLDSIRSKGYTATSTDAKLTIHTPKGTKEIPGKAVVVTGMGPTQNQEYAVISTQKYLEQAQLSCTNQSDLPSAQAALLAITIVHSE
jgi:hypothetical protein